MTYEDATATGGIKIHDIPTDSQDSVYITYNNIYGNTIKRLYVFDINTNQFLIFKLIEDVTFDSTY